MIVNKMSTTELRKQLLKQYFVFLSEALEKETQISIPIKCSCFNIQESDEVLNSQVAFSLKIELFFSKILSL